MPRYRSSKKSLSKRVYRPTLALDRSAKTPLYKQISEPIGNLIRTGEIPAGTLLENEVELAKSLNISRPTARRAIHELVAEGLVSRKKKAGTRVLAPADVSVVDQSEPKATGALVASLASLTELMLRQKLQPERKILTYEFTFAKEDQASKLELSTGSEIICLSQLRLDEQKPIGITNSIIPADLAPGIEELKKYGLYRSFVRHRRIPTKASFQVRSFRFAEANLGESGLYLAGQDQGLLQVKVTTFDQRGKIIEYGEHHFLEQEFILEFSTDS